MWIALLKLPDSHLDSKIKVSSSTDLVSIDDSIISYGNIGADETVYGDNISLYISPQAVENENLYYF